MNRREAIASLSTAVASSFTGATVEAKEADRPLLLVIRTPLPLRVVQLQALRDSTTNLLKGTSLENIPVFVCPHGFDLELVEDPRAANAH
ncbi:hypothetical protein SH661x_002302 [Planctomicrobium sp. SH661]|uniref:hypothetical protein n=1 Tax=Planctomicrobium sp. SH661 TaxID=3448124 RepID=UPI003F5C8E1A